MCRAGTGLHRYGQNMLVTDNDGGLWPVATGEHAAIHVSTSNYSHPQVDGKVHQH